jgi:streptogramin lyase
VWLGAYEIIWHYEHASQTWADYRLPEELITDYNFAYPRQIIVDQVGDVWVIMQMCGGASCGVAENLYRIHNGEWSLTITADYSQTGLRQLALDGNRQGWLVWEGMVYRLGDQPLEPFEQVEARGVSISPNGLIWVVAGSGDDASLQVFEP